jgi:beta-glucanase (GH16 family)
VGGGDLTLELVRGTESCGGRSEPSTSGMVTTENSFTFTYGAAEARIYLPSAGDGRIANWPAFWLDGENWPTSGEIDVMEGIDGQACFHLHSTSGADGTCAPGSYVGWHTYGVVWEPGSVTYYYDGVDVGSIRKGVTGEPMYLILNQAAASGVGDPPLAPSDMRVDYVRVWQSN